ncbi:sensor histidine kinase [Leptospira interrogans]
MPAWLPSLRREYALGTLLGFVIVAALMPLILVGGLGIYRFAETERVSEMKRVSSLAASLSQALDRELRGFLDAAEILAGQPHLQTGNIAAFERVAREAAAKADGHFVLIDRSLNQVVNTRTMPGAPLPKTGNPDGVREVFETGRATVGGLGRGAVANRLLFAVLVPISVNSQVRYVLAYAPRSDAVVEIVRQSFLPEDWFAAVLDRDGRILARSSRHEEFFGRLASDDFVSRLAAPQDLIVTTDLEGRRSVTAHHKTELSQWRAVVWVPDAILSAPVNKVFYLTLFMAALALALSLSAAVLAGRMIQHPARSVVRAAKALGEGRPVSVAPTLMREANIVVGTLAEASRTIAAREGALRESEQRTRFVMRELSHRSKNLLAIVQAMARQTARASGDYNEFQERFGDRIASLARSQDLLVHHDWNGIGVGDLVSTQLAPFIGSDQSRLSVTGPAVILQPEAAQTIGMALHELATNASKYGALSIPSGRVLVAWEVKPGADGDARFQMRWQEVGGPAVEKPTRVGFGHSVVERMVAASLDGQAQLQWKADGVVWSLDVPGSWLAGAPQNAKT